MPFLLAFQALLFYFPRFIWNAFSSHTGRQMTSGGSKISAFFKTCIRFSFENCSCQLVCFNLGLSITALIQTAFRTTKDGDRRILKPIKPLSKEEPNKQADDEDALKIAKYIMKTKKIYEASRPGKKSSR